MSALLTVCDLAVTFSVPGGDVPAVRGISFTVGPAETVALVGESGSGKSVTALSILQLLPCPPARFTGGSIRFYDTELVGAAEPVLRGIRGNRIAMVFQEPMTSLNPLHTIEAQITETLYVHKGMRRTEARTRTLELLHLVGLANAEARLGAFPHELSGGQRQRVMIAMALANEPDLLIADEPTTALDVTIQAQILALLKDLQKRFGMALLLITHDLGIVHKMADRVCVMQAGKIVEQAATTELFAAPQHPYTRHLLAAEPKGRPGPPSPDAPEVLAAIDIKVHFPVKKGIFRRTVDHIRAVDGITVRVRAGHTVGVVGESGSGKTTLGLAVLRLNASRGAIHFEGTNIQDWPTSRLQPLRRRMQ
ncbi:MAG: ATP-binding cassette domain-containing protein, partial [Rhodospirillaceae bacterium]